MADPAQAQNTGSGEGPPAVEPEATVAAKPVEPNIAANSEVKTDAPPAQAEEKKETAPIIEATAAPTSVPDAKEDQPKALEVNSNAEVPVTKEEPVKETVLVSELNIPNADPQPKDPPSTEVKDAPPVHTEVKEEVKSDSVSNDAGAKIDEAQPKEGDWQHREQELLKKIEELETLKKERTEDGLKLELKVREEEIDLLKARVKNLETELQAALSKPGGKNHEMVEKIKQQHEELLSKARGMIFDKTKMVKNQELQIEALTTQVQSLKDINLITKDLLEIRNSEVKAMEERLQVMEARFKAEKERYELVLRRAQTSTCINDDLRREYETQLKLFKELREKYELRVQALVAENNRLKEGGGASG